MKVRHRIGIAALPILFLAAAPAAADSRSPHPYFKPLAPPEAPGRAVASFALDEEIFAVADGAYANIRVLDGNGVEIPSLVRHLTLKKSVSRERLVSMDTVAFERLTNNCIEIVVSAHEAGHSINAVILHTGLRNFEKQVTVSGSEDRQAWTVLAEARPIFDYSRFIDLRHDRVDIAPGRYAFYKLDISNIVESPQSPLVQIVRETQDGALAREVEKTSFTREDFRIESMDFLETLESVLESDRVTRSYAINNMAVTNDVKVRTTIVTFDTPSVPLIELTLATPNVNFSRKLTVEGCNDNPGRHDAGTAPPAWQPIVSSTLARIAIGKFRQNSTAIGMGGVRRFRHYRLTVHNLDSPPLDITGVEAKGEVHEALFFREPSAVYRVFYGAPDMALPRYDIAAVLEKTEGPDADVFRAGKQEINAFYSPGRTPAFTGKRLLLPVVFLMVITLVWLIAKTVKRIGPV